MPSLSVVSKTNSLKFLENFKELTIVESNYSTVDFALFNSSRSFTIVVHGSFCKWLRRLLTSTHLMDWGKVLVRFRIKNNNKGMLP